MVIGRRGHRRQEGQRFCRPEFFLHVLLLTVVWILPGKNFPSRASHRFTSGNYARLVPEARIPSSKFNIWNIVLF